MSIDLNQVTEIGRLTRDVELKYTPSGTACAKFSIAVNEQIKSGNYHKDYVNYFDVVVWGNLGINCEKYLKKGSQVCVSGSLKQQRWTDNQSGQVRSKIEIVAQSVQFFWNQTVQNTTNETTKDERTKFSNDHIDPYTSPVSDPWGDENKESYHDKDIQF